MLELPICSESALTTVIQEWGRLIDRQLKLDHKLISDRALTVICDAIQGKLPESCVRNKSGSLGLAGACLEVAWVLVEYYCPRRFWRLGGTSLWLRLLELLTMDIDPFLLVDVGIKR